MLALLCRTIILVYIVQLVYTDRYHISSGGRDKFYVYKNRMALLASRPVKQEDQINYTSCIDTCNYMGKNCLTVTVLKNNTENFRCTYYDNDTLSFQMAPINSSTYVIRKGTVRVFKFMLSLKFIIVIKVNPGFYFEGEEARIRL